MEKATEWLGEAMPPWSEPCPLQVSFTNGGAGGATSFAYERGQVYQTMHIEGPPDRVVASVLPHEITHTVFAHYFRRPPPRWADEGGAVLSEDDIERRRHDAAAIEVMSTTGRFLPLTNLFMERDYGKDPLPLYAEGYAVSAYLVNLKGRKTFLQFVDSGMDSGWSHAAHRYYGFVSLDDLQQKWVSYCLGIFRHNRQQQQQRQQAAPLAQSYGQPPQGQAPIATFADPFSQFAGRFDKIESSLQSILNAHKGTIDGENNLLGELKTHAVKLDGLKAANEGFSQALGNHGTSLAKIKQDFQERLAGVETKLGAHGNLLQDLQAGQGKIIPAAEKIIAGGGKVLDTGAAIAANPGTSILLTALGGPWGAGAAALLTSLGGSWLILRRTLKPLAEAATLAAKSSSIAAATIAKTAPAAAGQSPEVVNALQGLVNQFEGAIGRLKGQPAAAPSPSAEPTPGPSGAPLPLTKFVGVPTDPLNYANLNAAMDDAAHNYPGLAGAVSLIRNLEKQRLSSPPKG